MAGMIFEPFELGVYLKQDIDADGATLAHDIALGAMRTASGHQQILRGTSTVELDGGLCDLHLPQRPVIVGGADPLTVVGESHGTYDPSTYRRRGHVLTLRSGLWDEVVTVTFTHGFAVVPADLKGVALALAARAYTNPRGLASITESVDDYARTERLGVGMASTTGLEPTPGEQRVLDRYFGHGAAGMVWFR